jgi:hypothetical protein
MKTQKNRIFQKIQIFYDKFVNLENISLFDKFISVLDSLSEIVINNISHI